MPADDDQQRRLHSLQLNNNLYGSVGLLHVSEAGAGAPGTFRVELLSDWFTASGFLCTSDHPCGTDAKHNTGDDVSHFGTTASLSITATRYLEAYGSFRSYANSNDLGKPKLLQVLGDSILGVKLFTPDEPGRMFRFGGEAQLLLVNGTGGVGFDGAGTGARIRGLATADFTERPAEKRLPLRIHANLGYHLDNSANVVEDTEKARGGKGSPLPITRIERFGLGINRVDFVETGIGVEGVFAKVRPFLEYSIDFPLNRQSYVCDKNAITTQAFHDGCLGEKTKDGMDFSVYPSRLTIGARGYPFLPGLAPIAALDIGISGTSDFIEEVAPQAPWTLYLGLGYAVDVVPPPPVVKTETVERVVQSAPPPQHFVRGLVHEQGTNTAVADAIVRVSGQTMGYATSADGKFETNNLAPGTYTFTITAPGYKEGTCTATVTASAPAAAPPAGTLAPNPFGAPSTMPASAPPPAAAPNNNAPQTTWVDVDCPLEALPRMGNLVGTVVDSKTNAPVSGVSVTLVGADGTSRTITTDGSGAFRAADMKPGEVSIKVEAEKYLMTTQTATIKPREDSTVTVSLTPRPKNPGVTITKQQIVIREQIHFETDSAVIKGDSTGILTELADAFARNPGIKKVEIQGHTDNTGTAEHNMDLSQRRANAVRDWLVAHGVEPGRLEAKGYGQTRPVAPNVTERNRARNRRVQFQILERQ